MKICTARSGALAAFVLLVSAMPALAQTNPYRTYPSWSAEVAARSMTTPALPYTSFAEGEIKNSGAVAPTFLDAVGVERVIGTSPGGSYFGVPGAMTRLFIDKPATTNIYGNIFFPVRDAGTNPPAACVRPVACDASGNPLNTQEHGALETGTIIYDIKPDIFGFALNLVDVETANATRVEIRFAANRGTEGQFVYYVPAGSNNQSQFFGFIFNQPITRVVVYMGHFANADGVVISQTWAARAAPVTPPPPPPPPPPPGCGDLNADSRVDIYDLSVVLARFGSNVGEGGRPFGDTNNDQMVDILDLSVILGSFNTSCGPFGDTIGDEPPPVDAGGGEDPPPDDKDPPQDPGDKDPPKDPGDPKEPGDPKDPGDDQPPVEPGDGSEEHDPRIPGLPGTEHDETPGDQPVEPVIPD